MATSTNDVRYYQGRADNLTGPIRMPVLVASPNLRVTRYDAAHLLRPSEAQLKAEARRAKLRDDQILGKGCAG